MKDVTSRQHEQSVSSDPLLAPFRLGKLKLRNRVISTSHASMLDEGGLPLERYQRYHEEKARGGLAMTMIGGSAMTSPDSSWGGGQLDLTSDRVIPHLRAVAERVHRHGAAVMTQISHLGRRATGYGGNWLPVLAPSRIRETRNRNFPKEMDRADIDRIVADYAAAAVRAREGGMDGIETITGGHLIGQFLSPRTNRRTDAFGGSVANRARFGLMVHEALRKAVGNDTLIGIRFVIDEDIEGGSDFEDCLKLARLFEREGHIDFFNCIYGRMDTELALAEDNMPGMFQPNAPFLRQVARFRREVALPLIHAAGIRDVATARHAIRENIVDLVGMTRAHIADPAIVDKISRGQEERIRPCVGASYCLYKKVHCIHNPVSGRETTSSHLVRPTDTPRKVVVVGGGPAGLEAARVAAERGHSVILLEAAPRLGGQILVATCDSERRDLVGIADWRARELERLKVDIRLNTYAGLEMVRAEDPGVVLVATGGIPDVDWLEGAQLCDTTWDLLTGAVPAKNDVLVFDGTGRHPAVSCALALARGGKTVRLVTADDVPALEMPYPDRASFRKRIAELGVECLVDMRLTRVARKGDRLVATLQHELTGVETKLAAQQVVLENGTVPADELYRELRFFSTNDGVTDPYWLIGRQAARSLRNKGDGGFVLHRIGDAVASRDIYSAIQEAYRLASLI